jgi:hypothetical protein
VDQRAGSTLPAVMGLVGIGKWLQGRTGVSRVVVRVCRHVLWIGLFTSPAIVLWWHVWTGHPTSTLTCPCGDPAQEVWFMAWPAWAVAHAANVFFSGAVNAPFGANLLSNTSGTLVGVVLSPVTWLWGPVASTNVALTLAPGLSAWGCWVALRRFVTWKPGAVPAALVYGYSAALVSSLPYGHVSVAVLVVPPLLFATLYDIVARQGRTPWRDGLALAALIVVQFLISPEILVMCALLAGVGLAAAAVLCWREVLSHLAYAAAALGLGLGLSAVLLAYPAWFGLKGPQSVSGILFTLAPLSGVLISQFLSPGAYASPANTFTRFGGYFGRIGPPPNYVGWGVAVTTVASIVVARRRRLVSVLVLLLVVAVVLSLGSYLLGGSLVLSGAWLPWRTLGRLPVLKEILPDQFAPFAPLFVSFVLALGLDGVYMRRKRTNRQQVAQAQIWTTLATVVVAAAVLVPVFVTFDLPFTVQSFAIPHWMSRDATRLPPNTVVLTVPFAVSGSTKPMLWLAVDDMHFRLAGAALKTPTPGGGPVGQGATGSARRILTDLSIPGDVEPTGTEAQLSEVRQAVQRWEVDEVVVDGPSRDPIYASGFLTASLGTAPSYVHGAWVWKIPRRGLTSPSIQPAATTTLAACRAGALSSASAGSALAMAHCVLGRDASP